MQPTAAVHRYLTTAAASQFRHRKVDLLESWQGSDHLLWRVECQGRLAVVKLFLDAGQARSRRQYAGQERYAPWGLAPRPLWVDRYPEGLARQILVYEWLPGEPVSGRDPAQRLSLAAAVAQVHRDDGSQTGGVSPNPVNLAYAWRLAQGSAQAITRDLAASKSRGTLAQFQDLADRTADLVREGQGHWQGVAAVPVHGDLRVENTLFGRGQAVLLDWERYGLGDAALEVANFLLYGAPQWEEAARQAWLDAYLAEMDDPGLASRIRLYGRFLPFQTACFLLDGLRTLAAESVPEEARAEMGDFLTRTITAALTQAAAVLGGAPVDPATADEIARMVRRRSGMPES